MRTLKASARQRITPYVFFFILSEAFASPPQSENVNEGAFSSTEKQQPTPCFSVRRKERTGFEAYAAGGKFTDPTEKPGNPPAYYPFDGAQMTLPHEAYQDISENRPADIICIGDNLNIVEPIFSNGGDVFMLANEIKIDAPIDTRMYFDIARRERYLRCSVSIGDSLENFYKSYHRKNPEAVLVDGKYLAPEYPSGATIQFSDGVGGGRVVRDGTPPPEADDADQALTNSGNIVIFAKSFKVNSALQQGEPGGPGICNSTFRKFAFQAGGLRGGKGGLGSPSGCPYYMSICIEEIMTNSGVNAAPSGGGNGGNVSLYKVGEVQFGEEERSQLVNSINVEGGNSGVTEKFKTISAMDIKNGVSSDICARDKVGDYTAASKGEPGHIYIGQATMLEAVRQTEIFALRSDARPSVDLRDLVVRSRTNRQIEHRNMGEFLRSTFSKLALRAERDWANAIADIVSGRVVSLPPSIEPLGTISKSLGKDNGVFFSSGIDGLIRRISYLERPDSTGISVYYYFHSKGGAFSVVNPDTTSALSGKVITEDLAAIQEVTNEQLDTLKSMESILGEQLYNTQKNGILSAMESIQSQLKKLSIEIKSPGLNLDGISSSIDKAMPLIADFIDRVAGQKYIEAAKSFPALITEISNIYSMLLGNSLSNNNREAIVILKSSLRALDTELGRLYAAYASVKNEIVDARFYIATRELASRHRVVSRIDGRLPIGEDIIKHAFISYYMDPTKNKSFLVENLREAAVYLSGRTEYTPMLRLYPLTERCTSAAPGNCILLPESSRFRVITSNIGGISFPIWVVAPSKRSTYWPKYNAAVEKITKETQVMQ